MKLIDDFFELLYSHENETGFTSRIELNSGHLVYTGHFPGYPVTPGVIQLQIVHELLEQHFRRKLKLKTIPQCKFLKILNPHEISQLVIFVQLNKNDGVINVKATGESAFDVIFKLKSTYQ
jgi:3-hydroxyacyl-[acyl-carrier-protein] dehydratase